MRNIATAGLVGLVALAAACGGGGRELQYGAAQAPTLDEQAAATDAQAALAASLAFAPTTEPTAGAPGLADQLVAGLGGSAAPTGALPAPAAAQARRALGRAVSLPATAATFDAPACVATGEASVTWSGCVVTLSEVDPASGDATDVTVHVDGRLGRDPASGVTSWSIVETMAMVMTSGGDTMRMNATVRLGGAVTVAAGTIKGHTASSVDATASARGLSASEAVTTTLDLDLAYQADPFCLAGGTLTLQQVWSRRPTGASAADLPDQGWRFEWTGCGLFTVAHGA